MCGTWIDGKPIYRRIIQSSFPTILDGQYAYRSINITSYNISKITSINAVAMFGSSYSPVPFSYVSGTYVMTCDVFYDGTFLRIRGNSSGWSNAEVITTLEYTKTTD